MAKHMFFVTFFPVVTVECDVEDPADLTEDEQASILSTAYKGMIDNPEKYVDLDNVDIDALSDEDEQIVRDEIASTNNG